LAVGAPPHPPELGRNWALGPNRSPGGCGAPPGLLRGEARRRQPGLLIKHFSHQGLESFNRPFATSIAPDFRGVAIGNWVGSWDGISTAGARRKGSRQALFERNWVP
jgi:hypothetical protein